MAKITDLFNRFRKSINAQDKKTGDTRLHIATRQGNTTEVKKLLKKGANPNIQNKRGMVPLHIAAYWGEHVIVRKLLEAGADVNATNGRGWTPLHSAALAGGMRVRHKTITPLLEAGARDDTEDKFGWTARRYMELWEVNASEAARVQKTLIDEEIKEKHHAPPKSISSDNLPKFPKAGWI